MTRPVAKLMLLAVYFTVMTQVHSSENIGTVVDMIDDLSEEVFQVKEDLLGMEAKTLKKINWAKISLKSELIQDLKQHVRDAIAEILQGESIEEMVRSQVVSEVRELKRGRHHMKGQLRHVLNTVRDLKEEREANKGVSMNPKDGSELKCIIVSEGSTVTHSAKDNTSRFEQSVTNLSRALQSNKEQIGLIKVSLNTTTQNLSNTKSKLKEVEALLGEELQSKNSELTKVQASVNATVQDLMRTKSKVEIVQASLKEQGEDLLNTSSELVTAVSTISAMKDKQRDNISRLHALEKRNIELLRITNKIRPVVYFKAFSTKMPRVTKWATLKFDNVSANIGNCYSSRTGVFRVPVSGIYLVTVLLGTESSSLRDYRIMNGENVETHVSIKGPGFATAKMTTIIHANGWDSVYVRGPLGSTRIRGNYRSYFSGFLLRAD